MSSMLDNDPFLTTDRMVLRQWRSEDYPLFAEINADPKAMRYFPAPLTREESDAMAERCKQTIAESGWGFWAVELREEKKCIGIVGLRYKEDDFPNGPFYEVGWRIAAAYWGKGLAPEAATAAINYAFERLGAEKVCAYTTLSNEPSRRVMEKLAMTDCQQDFDHPDLEPDHPLVRHCLYCVNKEKWQSRDEK